MRKTNSQKRVGQLETLIRDLHRARKLLATSAAAAGRDVTIDQVISGQLEQIDRAVSVITESIRVEIVLHPHDHAKPALAA